MTRRQHHSRKRRPTPYHIYGAVAALATVAVAGYGIAQGMVWWAAYLLAINAVTFALFGFDKAIAGGRALRVPERVLYALALLGASPALLLGQWLFRHKTAKASFQIIFWLIVAAQVALLAYGVFR